jgi:2-succinyl-6-hydroxy-2,4-cyclohexadiene-1-carboxylate synthase
LEQKQLIVGGVELSVRDYFNEGPAVIFLPYEGGNHETWGAVLPYFLGSFRGVTMDMRGQGKSGRPKGASYSIDTMADDVIGVMDQLGISAANLVGSSSGAEIALSAAARYPDRVLSVTSEGAIQNVFGEDGRYDTPENEVESVRAQMFEALRANPFPEFDSRAKVTTYMREMFYYGSSEPWTAVKQAVADYDVRQTGEGKYTCNYATWARDDYRQSYWRADFDAYFRKIECPVLFLPGEDEMGEPRIVASLERYRGLLGQSALIPLAGAVHASSMYDIPETFSHAILAFIRTFTAD